MAVTSSPLCFALVAMVALGPMARADDGPAAETSPPPTTTTPSTTSSPSTTPETAPPPAASAAPVAPLPAAPERARILALDLESTNEVPEARAINDLIAVELGGDLRLEVISGADVRRLADLEAQKQTVGCAESSCLAEIAGAMGAEFVLFGQIGRLGDSTLVTMQLFDATRAVAAGRVSVQERNVERLPVALGPALQDLLRPLMRERFGPDAELQVKHTLALPPSQVGLSTAGTVALVGGGAVVVGVAAILVGAIPGTNLRGLQDRWFESGGTDLQALDEAKGWQQWYPAADVLQIGGLVLVGGGLLTAGGGAAWALFVRESP